MSSLICDRPKSIICFILSISFLSLIVDDCLLGSSNVKSYSSNIILFLAERSKSVGKIIIQATIIVIIAKILDVLGVIINR